MQPKSVPIPLGGKAVREDAGQVIRIDADAAVFQAQFDLVQFVHANGNGNALVPPGRGVNGVLGVADQVHQDLQHLVLVHRNHQHLHVRECHVAKARRRSFEARPQ